MRTPQEYRYALKCHCFPLLSETIEQRNHLFISQQLFCHICNVGIYLLMIITHSKSVKYETPYITREELYLQCLINI
jgi:hypothetical protein